MLIQNDESMKGDIIAALSMCPGVKANDIRVNVEKSRVRLTGVVDTLDEKSTAGQTARCIKGVDSVENDLIVSMNGEISDLEMENAGRQKLDARGYPGIGIKVEAGTASLMGVISNTSTKDIVMGIARDIKGIRNVISKLEIAAGVPVDNIKLSNNVSEALSIDGRLDTIDLNVIADNGEVTISGSISNLNQYRIASTVAESVPGVKEVHNNLIIKEITRQ
ncbi:MAG: BON domain-containing protein [Armatimonadota bacterium]